MYFQSPVLPDTERDALQGLPLEHGGLVHLLGSVDHGMGKAVYRSLLQDFNNNDLILSLCSLWRLVRVVITEWDWKISEIEILHSGTIEANILQGYPPAAGIDPAPPWSEAVTRADYEQAGFLPEEAYTGETEADFILPSLCTTEIHCRSILYLVELGYSDSEGQPVWPEPLTIWEKVYEEKELLNPQKVRLARYLFPPAESGSNPNDLYRFIPGQQSGHSTRFLDTVTGYEIRITVNINGWSWIVYSVSRQSESEGFNFVSPDLKIPESFDDVVVCVDVLSPGAGEGIPISLPPSLQSYRLRRDGGAGTYSLDRFPGNILESFPAELSSEVIPLGGVDENTTETSRFACLEIEEIGKKKLQHPGPLQNTGVKTFYKTINGTRHFHYDPVEIPEESPPVTLCKYSENFSSFNLPPIDLSYYDRYTGYYSTPEEVGAHCYSGISLSGVQEIIVQGNVNTNNIDSFFQARTEWAQIVPKSKTVIKFPFYEGGRLRNYYKQIIHPTELHVPEILRYVGHIPIAADDLTANIEILEEEEKFVIIKISITGFPTESNLSGVENRHEYRQALTFSMPPVTISPPEGQCNLPLIFPVKGIKVNG